MATAQDQSRRGGGEDDHKAVAQVLDLGAPGGGDGLPEGREVLAAHIVAASGVSEEASSVEPTRSVKSTVMFSVVATEPPVPAIGRKIRRDQGFLHHDAD